MAQLLIYGKLARECDTTHYGGQLKLSKDLLAEWVFVHNPLLLVQFLKVTKVFGIM
jgi:hypothetical protein